MEVKTESEVAQLCPTLSDPMDCNPPGSSVHGIFQARVLEWVAIDFSKENPKAQQKEACKVTLWNYNKRHKKILRIYYIYYPVKITGGRNTFELQNTVYTC